MKFERSDWLKIGLLAVYALVIVGVYVSLQSVGIGARDLPDIIRHWIVLAGPLGPLALIGFYILTTIIPFPTAALAVLGGALFGPWMGAATVIVGVNLAATISFWLARYLGRHFISESERGWVKQYDELMTKQGMYAVMAMRLLFFPFDIVSIGAGLTRMAYGEYIVGTFFGSLPSTVSFVVLGQSLNTPSSWALFAALMVLSIFAAVLVHRSDWAKAHVLKKELPIAKP